MPPCLAASAVAIVVMALRRTVAEKRDRFIFEAQIPEVIDFYRDLVGRPTPLGSAVRV